MMGRQSGQMSMVILDLSELIPEDHLLRKINQMISFDFIYDLVAPYYPTNGRPSVVDSSPSNGQRKKVASCCRIETATGGFLYGTKVHKGGAIG